MPDRDLWGAAAPPTRLHSLDAYRGFVMLAMASAGLGWRGREGRSPTAASGQFLAPDRPRRLGGCAFWDLIQPSFMFIVGVAMPCSRSPAARPGRGLGRAVRARPGAVASVLVVLGVFLSSDWAAADELDLRQRAGPDRAGLPVRLPAAGPAARAAVRRRRSRSWRATGSVRPLPAAGPCRRDLAGVDPAYRDAPRPLGQERQRGGRLRPLVPQPVPHPDGRRSGSTRAATRRSTSCRRSPR